MPQVKEMKKVLFVVLFLISTFIFIEEVNASEFSMLDSVVVLVEEPKLDFYEGDISCSAMLGTNIVKVIKAALTLVRIGSSIAAILIGMMTFLPALTNGDAKEFNAAIKKCIWLAIVLMLIILLPVLLRTTGNLFNWDLCGII